MFYQFIRKGEVILSEIHEETVSSQTKYKKTKTKVRSVHQGHRERVKQRFLKHNLDVFEEHQILELLLFYGLPRADTNPIAHELLDRFGTISGVCDAPIEELTRTKGITQNVAILLKLIPQLSRHYINTQTSDKERIYDTNSAMRIISPQFIGRKNEMVVLVLMDSKNRVLYCGVVTEGNVNTVPLYIRKIITLAATYNAAEAIIAHNHPSGNVMPSPGDIIATRKLNAAMETIDVHLQDHIIFGYPDYLSMKDCGLLAHILKPENQVIQTEEAEQYNPKIIKMKTPFGKGQIKSTRLAFYESKRKQHKNKQD